MNSHLIDQSFNCVYIFSPRPDFRPRILYYVAKKKKCIIQIYHKKYLLFIIYNEMPTNVVNLFSIKNFDEEDLILLEDKIWNTNKIIVDKNN